MFEWNAGGDQRVLEREGAAEHEPDEIVAPEVGDVGDFFRSVRRRATPDIVEGRVRRSRSEPSSGTAGMPGPVTPIIGHGFGFNRQKRAKSSATSAGRTTRFPCAKRGASPAVVPVSAPYRARRTDVAPDHAANARPRVSGRRNAAIPMTLYAIIAKIAIARDSGIVAEM